MKVICVKTPKERAEEVLGFLLKYGYLDKSRKVERDRAFVYFPVVSAIPEFDCVEMECIEREKFVPFRQIAKKLGVEEAGLPRKWEKFGTVVVLKLPECLETRKEEIGRVYAEVLGAKTVVADRSGIYGEFRKPAFEVIYGNDTVTVHKESGVRFKFDVLKLMYSSGNIFERGRLIGLVRPGEVIVDMFAGIGYFSIPIAMKTEVAKIYACEKNPEAFEFLTENIRLNRVEAKVVPLLGDCREVAPANVADRVIMGYLKETDKFLPHALRCLKAGKGIIHYHDVVRAGQFPGEILERIKARIPRFEVLLVRVVKSYAPRMVHGVVDLRVV
ncbi:MAG: class I SAM-dependent methyltransferase family protein [Thermoplasmata archaeon]|nr:class I SAM-dependent methyltransferase family protein [Thermoplasmata archaeon]